jgi:hypothetical protein
MLRAAVAIIIVTLAFTFEAIAAAWLPPSYTIGLSLFVPLAAFAAVAWAFVPNRKGMASRGAVRTPPRRRERA